MVEFGYSEIRSNEPNMFRNEQENTREMSYVAAQRFQSESTTELNIGFTSRHFCYTYEVY